MNRKGQSEIITTILLILIVLAAVVVVWMVISKFINPTQNAGCATLHLRIIGADNSSGTVTVNRMSGSPETKITDLKVIVNGLETGVTAPPSGSILGELETKSYGIAVNAGDKVAVAPIIDIGDEKTWTCDVVGETRAVE